MAKYLRDMRVGDEYIVQINYGTGVDITGYKFWLTLKASPDLPDDQAALQYTTVAGDEVNDDVLNGLAHLVVPSNITKTVAAGEYYYDVQAKRPDADGVGITTLVPPITDMEDLIAVYQEITRAIS